MGLDFPGYVYLPCMEIFARQVIVTPVVSAPGAAAYTGRGIFDTNELEIDALDESLIVDFRTELDIMEMEWTVLPQQGDLISIPQDGNLDGGNFLVKSIGDRGNAGGEVTLVLERCVEWGLIGYQYDLGSPIFDEPALSPSVGPNLDVGSPIIAIVPLTVQPGTAPVVPPPAAPGFP